MAKRKPYPTDVSNEEWSFAAPYLTLMHKDAPQRRHELREMFKALRWIQAGCVETMVITTATRRVDSSIQKSGASSKCERRTQGTTWMLMHGNWNLPDRKLDAATLLYVYPRCLS